MKKLFWAALTAFAGFPAIAQQGAGLVISEALPNPAGTDSPFEWIELVATRTINFTATPYTVVVCNNGTANTQGWVAGGGLTYAFEITTGTVNAGDVVYVGGSSMAPTGTILRSINTGTTNGDGFGAFNTAGVVGNGGTNADGIAVFANPASALTPATVPVDAIFYGSAIGSALVSAGNAGYQMPYNDHYAGGKLQATSFLAPDPASAQVLKAAGVFNPTTGAFTTPRVWTLGTFTNDNLTDVTLSSTVASASIAFSGVHAIVNENAGTATVNVAVTNSNPGQIVFTVKALPFSTASLASDYTQQDTTIVIPPNTSGTYTLNFTIIDDATSEKDEYIALGFVQRYNVTAAANAGYFLYIRDNDTPAPLASNELNLSLLTSFSNGAAGSNSAEIVAHDPTTQRLYIANSIGAKLDIVNFANPAAPALITSVNITPYGNINSVAVRDSIVAVAVEAANPQDSGKVVFFDYNGTFISQVKVGAMPDMITFNHAGNKVITPCEGEPNNAYTVDPVGEICVVDISGGVANVTQSNVTFIGFTAFNGQENALRAQGTRIYGLNANAAQDFEPEYITISDDDLTGYVTLQENNAVAVINFQTNTVAQILPLGYKNYNSGNNAMDQSDQTGGIVLAQFPVKGMYTPDAIAGFTLGNQHYLVTANEGDARAYGGFNEESRFSGLTLDPVKFPFGAIMKQNTFLGRLNCTNKWGDTDNDGDIDTVYTYGARSYSIWNATTGALVYDSGDQLERITSTHPVYSTLFNMSNTVAPSAVKNRSDDKGPEPEGVATATINGVPFVFASMERIGGVMIFNVSNPAAPQYAGYYNNRTVSPNGPDLGAEGLVYIDAQNSPNGQPLLLLANEVSSTLSVYQIQTCAQASGVTVTAASSGFCAGDSVLLSAVTVPNTTYQWQLNGAAIPGATSATYYADIAGNYNVAISNTINSCSGTTPIQSINVFASPTVTATASQSQVCSGTTVNLTATGATTYNWQPGNLAGAGITVTPTSATTYTIIGTNSNGCTDTTTVSVGVLPAPTVTASASVTSLCAGNPVTLSAAGASTYNWAPITSSSTSVTINPTSTTTYTVTGTAANGCTRTATITVTVLPRPTIVASVNNTTFCEQDIVTLSATGGSNYMWFPGLLTGSPVQITAGSVTSYTVNAVGGNGCQGSDTINFVVNPRPQVDITLSQNAVCGTATLVSLTGGTPSGGTYSGLGVSGNIFDPAIAGVGMHYVSYSYTAGNGCSASDSAAISVNAIPQVQLTLQQDTVCTTTTLITLSGGSPSGGTYSGPGVNGNIFDPATAGVGTHYVLYEFIDANGCSATDSAAMVVDLCTDIADMSAATAVTMYPNPTDGVVRIVANSDVQSLRVLDVQGREVYNIMVNAKQADVNLSGFAAGLYFVRVMTADREIVLELIKY